MTCRTQLATVSIRGSTFRSELCTTSACILSLALEIGALFSRRALLAVNAVCDSRLRLRARRAQYRWRIGTRTPITGRAISARRRHSQGIFTCGAGSRGGGSGALPACGALRALGLPFFSADCSRGTGYFLTGHTARAVESDRAFLAGEVRGLPVKAIGAHDRL